ncbi:hypothetical protein [Mycoplasma buteonis]|uniref:hypothetical protein n=1 Tax=Mycoplasma buteonis TaxID=171280 RepID=UPI00055C20DE|nr:hypothetical protein [Mycoplasma buteonis]
MENTNNKNYNANIYLLGTVKDFEENVSSNGKKYISGTIEYLQKKPDRQNTIAYLKFLCFNPKIIENLQRDCFYQFVGKYNITRNQNEETQEYFQNINVIITDFVPFPPEKMRFQYYPSILMLVEGYLSEEIKVTSPGKRLNTQFKFNYSSKIVYNDYNGNTQSNFFNFERQFGRDWCDEFLLGFSSDIWNHLNKGSKVIGLFQPYVKTKRDSSTGKVYNNLNLELSFVFFASPKNPQDFPYNENINLEGNLTSQSLPNTDHLKMALMSLKEVKKIKELQKESEEFFKELKNNKEETLQSSPTDATTEVVLNKEEKEEEKNNETLIETKSEEKAEEKQEIKEPKQQNTAVKDDIFAELDGYKFEWKE